MPIYNNPNSSDYDPSLPVGYIKWEDVSSEESVGVVHRFIELVGDFSNDALIENLIKEVEICCHPYSGMKRSEDLKNIKKEILSRMK